MSARTPWVRGRRATGLTRPPPRTCGASIRARVSVPSNVRKSVLLSRPRSDLHNSAPSTPLSQNTLTRTCKTCFQRVPACVTMFPACVCVCQRVNTYVYKLHFQHAPAYVRTHAHALACNAPGVCFLHCGATSATPPATPGRSHLTGGINWAVRDGPERGRVCRLAGAESKFNM